MEAHEWNEHTDEGKRFYRATWHADKWTIITTLKHEPLWNTMEVVPEEIWRELRDIVFRKYQRKRVPWERVVEIDKILGDESPTN